MITGEFIKKHRYAILEVTSGTRLFASVAMAQAILESGSGQSKLATQYNNLYGIKAGEGWTGPKVMMDTLEYFTIGWPQKINDEFRQYPSPEASIRDWVKLLTKNENYDDVLKAKTPQQQVREIQAAGYATDPNYSDKLINLINEHQLENLDKDQKNMKSINLMIAMLLIAIAILIIYKIFKY